MMRSRRSKILTISVDESRVGLISGTNIKVVIVRLGKLGYILLAASVLESTKKVIEPELLSMSRKFWNVYLYSQNNHLCNGVDTHTQWCVCLPLQSNLRTQI